MSCTGVKHVCFEDFRPMGGSMFGQDVLPDASANSTPGLWREGTQVPQRSEPRPAYRQAGAKKVKTPRTHELPPAVSGTWHTAAPQLELRDAHTYAYVRLKGEI